MKQLLSELPAGSRIKDLNTTYLGKPIEWIVLEQNHDGIGTTSLMSADILCLKAFDAAEPENKDMDTRDYGNSRYSQSNLLQWLNASESDWYEAKHEADQSPDAKEYVTYNPYTAEPGFLTGFGEDFLENLQTVVKKTVLNNEIEGNGFEEVRSRIFLLSPEEIGLINEIYKGEGMQYEFFKTEKERMARPTAEAVRESDYSHEWFSEKQFWNWWLRTAFWRKRYMTEGVHRDGSWAAAPTNCGIMGVRPACAILSSALVSNEPDTNGTYEILWNEGTADLVPRKE